MCATSRTAKSSCSTTKARIRTNRFRRRRRGRASSNTSISRARIGEDAIVTDRNIDVHVRALRQKLGEHAECLETVRGVGYRFAEPAR
jgi:two-component system phosphate regulon response regulator PhoB